MVGQIGGNEMKLKKEWKDVEKTSKELYRRFNIWRLSNIHITHGNGRTVEEMFGFPYTSSSSFAAIWNCQAEAVYKWSLHRSHKYPHLDISLTLPSILPSNER